MNNKAIIEFGFRGILRILQISESVIYFGLRRLWITSSLNFTLTLGTSHYLLGGGGEGGALN